MSILKFNFLLICIFAFTLNVFAQNTEDTQTQSAGEKSHNGVVEKMSPEEVAKKIEDKKKIKDAKKDLKADGKYSKEDRKEIRKMRKDKKSANVAEPTKVVPPPSKDTQQMIDEADAEADLDEAESP